MTLSMSERLWSEEVGMIDPDARSTEAEIGYAWGNGRRFRDGAGPYANNPVLVTDLRVASSQGQAAAATGADNAATASARQVQGAAGVAGVGDSVTVASRQAQRVTASDGTLTMDTALRQAQRVSGACTTAVSGMASTRQAQKTGATATASSSATLYVATTGSDSNSGTADAPFATIQHALDVAVPGDVISIASGTYHESIYSTVDGTAADPITLMAAVQWGAKIVPPTSNARGFGLETRGDYIVIDGLEVDGSTDPTSGSRWTVGIGVSGKGSIVQNCHVHHIYRNGTPDGSGGAGILLDSWYSILATGQVARGNVVHHVGPVGDTNHYHGIYTTAQGRIDSNLCHNNTGGGIQGWHDISHCVFANNTSFANGHGFLFGGGDYVNTSGPADYCTFANNIAYGNDDIGFDQEGDFGTHNVWTHNLSYGNGQNWRLNSGTHSNDATGDPLFVGYQADGTGDYHLQAGSPCMGAGDATYAPATDVDGVAYASPPALGCYR